MRSTVAAAILILGVLQLRGFPGARVVAPTAPLGIIGVALALRVATILDRRALPALCVAGFRIQSPESKAS